MFLYIVCLSTLQFFLPLNAIENTMVSATASLENQDEYAVPTEEYAMLPSQDQADISRLSSLLGKNAILLQNEEDLFNAMVSVWEELTRRAQALTSNRDTLPLKELVKTLPETTNELYSCLSLVTSLLSEHGFEAFSKLIQQSFTLEKEGGITSFHLDTMQKAKEALNRMISIQKKKKRAHDDTYSQLYPHALLTGLEISTISPAFYHNYYEPSLLREAIKRYRTVFMSTGSKEKALNSFNTALTSILETTILSPTTLTESYTPTYTPDLSEEHASYFQALESIQHTIKELLISDCIIMNDDIHTILMTPALSKESDTKNILGKKASKRNALQDKHPYLLLVDIEHSLQNRYLRPSLLRHAQTLLKISLLKKLRRRFEKYYSDSVLANS